MWGAYCEVSQAFADTVRDIYEEGDMIWVHGYHMMVLPALIRELVPQATIGFSLHLPWPTSEIFRVLPWRSDMLRGMLGADVIQFQTWHHARHFVRSCNRVLGLDCTPLEVKYRGHVSRLLICPVGIDLQRVKSLQRRRAVRNRALVLRERFERRFIIVGMDRCVETAGIVQKLMAFEEFLARNPKLRDSVVLMQIVLPVNQKLVSYETQDLQSRINQLAGRCNARFARITSQVRPVYCLHQSLASDDLCALYESADCAMVTPTAEGMNLVPFEYLMCRENKGKPGTVIVSEFAGSASSLAGALIVNPASTDGMAAAIADVVKMSRKDRKKRHAQMRQSAETFTASYWLHTCTTCLEETITAKEESGGVYYYFAGSKTLLLDVLETHALERMMLRKQKQHMQKQKHLEGRQIDEVYEDGKNDEGKGKDKNEPNAGDSKEVQSEASFLSGAEANTHRGHVSFAASTVLPVTAVATVDGGGRQMGASPAATSPAGGLAENVGPSLEDGMHLVLVDLEGVLVEAQAVTELITIPRSVRTHLLTICASRNLQLMVMSSRRREVVEQLLTGIPCWIGAEHGYVVRLTPEVTESPSAWQVVPDIPINPTASAAWLDTVTEIVGHYGKRTPGSFIETTPVSVSLRLEEADREYATSVRQQLLATLSETIGGMPVRAYRARQSVDVVHIAVDKGAAVRLAMEKLHHMVIGEDLFMAGRPNHTSPSGQFTRQSSVLFSGGSVVSATPLAAAGGTSTQSTPRSRSNTVTGIINPSGVAYSPGVSPSLHFGAIDTVLCVLAGYGKRDEGVFSLLRDTCDVAVAYGDKLIIGENKERIAKAAPASEADAEVLTKELGMARGGVGNYRNSGRNVAQAPPLNKNEVFGITKANAGIESEGVIVTPSKMAGESGLLSPSMRSGGSSFEQAANDKNSDPLAVAIAAVGENGAASAAQRQKSAGRPIAIICTLNQRASTATTKAVFIAENGMVDVAEYIGMIAERVAIPRVV